MAIAATAGGSGSTTAAAASKALSSFNVTAGRNVYVAVALDNTAASVTSITDTKGNTYSLIGAVNGTGIRAEIWKSVGVAAQAGNVITINVSPNCNIAGAAEEYSGVSSEGITGTASGSDTYPRLTLATQDGGNFVLSAMAFACQSGDTINASAGGTRRQFSVPAATAAGVALMEKSNAGNATLTLEAVLSTSRNWAASAVELRSGGADVSYVDWPDADGPDMQQDADIRYLNVLEPDGWENGLSGGGGSGNAGFVA